MDEVENIKENFDKKRRETEKMYKQYLGLLKFEESLTEAVDLNIHAVHKDIYTDKIFEANSGGRIVNNFGIENFNETAMTLLTASIKNEKKKSKRILIKSGRN